MRPTVVKAINNFLKFFQNFILFIIQGCDSASSDQAAGEEVSGGGPHGTLCPKSVLDSGDHSLTMLSGLQRLRQTGLLLDTCLWAEGVSYQVSKKLIVWINLKQRLKLVGLS